MIYKDGTNASIEISKAQLGLTGDVYVYDGEDLRRRIASLESHRQLIPDSTAQTIEEAYAERIEYERARADAARAAAAQMSENEESEDFEE